MDARRDTAQAKYTNPVYPHYFADPFVWCAGPEYYAIGTGRTEAEGTVVSLNEPTIFPLLRSADLIHWQEVGRALIRPDPSVGNTFWAPEVVYSGKEWLLYYSVGHADRMHQLRVAASAQPAGPYVDCAALTILDECAFAIDPHPFRDEDGRWYLFHARDFQSEVDEDGRPVRAGTALVVYELLSMTRLSPGGRTIARARCDWQRFASGRQMYGRVFDWHTLEGPYVVKSQGRYYCFYSGGCWHGDTYGVDYVVADSVMGPYSDDGVERGPRVLRSRPPAVLGPGHCSIVSERTTDLHWIVYHAWDAEMTARRMCIDPLYFTSAGPSSPGPTWTEHSVGSFRSNAFEE